MKTMTARSAALLAIAVLLARPAGAGGRQDRDKMTEVSGTVRVVGSMPFTELVITDEDGADWFIDKDERDKLDGRSGQSVRVRGKASSADLVLANGAKAGVRRSLKDIEILAPPMPPLSNPISN